MKAKCTSYRKLCKRLSCGITFTEIHKSNKAKNKENIEQS